LVVIEKKNEIWKINSKSRPKILVKIKKIFWGSLKINSKICPKILLKIIKN